MSNAKCSSSAPAAANATRCIRRLASARDGSARKCRAARKAVVLHGYLSKFGTAPKTVKRVPSACTSRQDRAAPKRSAKPRFRRGTARKRPVLLASERPGAKNGGVRNSPNAFFQTNAAVSRSHGTQGALGMSPHAVPNPSFKRSANGRPPGPAGRYAVHFLPAGPGVLPSSPA